jgi:hypothetical protein
VAAQRAALAGYGVTVAADCDASTNFVNVAGKVTALALRALLTGAAQPLSCADTPGASDQVLTAADVATLDGVADQMNVQLKALAAAHGWAYADLDPAFTTAAAAAGAFRASAHLACAAPFGLYLSLDGVRPTAAGQQLVADVVSEAINATYHLGLPIAGVPLDLTANPCP